MRKKYRKFYADWRDEKGRRRMKAFPTKGGALRHQNAMRAQVAGKKARASAPSRTSRLPGQRRTTHAATRSASPAKSPRSPARSAHTK